MKKASTSERLASCAKSQTPSSNYLSAANPRVDWYFDKNERWESELRKLRAIALDFPMIEELKWGCPCYTLSSGKIVLLHVFKEYCAILFFKGALLKDDHHILVQQTKNVQAARQIRFTDVGEVVKLEHVVTGYIREAIAVERSGRQVELKETAQFEMPAEFKSKLKEMPALKEAFYALTPGRQRGYLLHFSSAKQSKTREARGPEVHGADSGRQGIGRLDAETEMFPTAPLSLIDIFNGNSSSAPRHAGRLVDGTRHDEVRRVS